MHVSTKAEAMSTYGQLRYWVDNLGSLGGPNAWAIALPANAISTAYNRLNFTDGQGVALMNDQLAPESYIANLESVVGALVDLYRLHNAAAADQLVAWWSDIATPALSNAMARDAVVDATAGVAGTAKDVLGQGLSLIPWWVPVAGIGLLLWKLADVMPRRAQPALSGYSRRRKRRR